MSCGVGRRHGLDPKLLWLWRRLTAALIRSLAWELPYPAGVGLKRKKKNWFGAKLPHFSFVLFPCVSKWVSYSALMSSRIWTCKLRNTTLQLSFLNPGSYYPTLPPKWDFSKCLFSSGSKLQPKLILFASLWSIKPICEVSSVPPTNTLGDAEKDKSSWHPGVRLLLSVRP